MAAENILPTLKKTGKDLLDWDFCLNFAARKIQQTKCWPRQVAL
jgi:hypothetical protein